MQAKFFDPLADYVFDDGRRYVPHGIRIRTVLGCYVVDWAVLDCRNCGVWRYRVRYWGPRAYTDRLEKLMLVRARKLVYRHLLDNRQCPGASSDTVEADICLSSDT